VASIDYYFCTLHKINLLLLLLLLSRLHDTACPCSYGNKSVRSPTANNHFPAQPPSVDTPHLRGISANNRTNLMYIVGSCQESLSYILVDNSIHCDDTHFISRMGPAATTNTGPK